MIDDFVINQKTDGSYFKRIKSVFDVPQSKKNKKKKKKKREIDDYSATRECSKHGERSEETAQSNLPNIA